MIVFKGGRRSASGARTGLLKSFGGLITYLTKGSRDRDALNPDRVAWTSCRNLYGVNDPARVAQIMRAHASEHPRVEKPVYHFGLSLHPDEHLSPEQWDQAVDRLLQQLGLGRHQALVVAHRDTDHEHVHVVVNRVGDDGRAWEKENDLVKASGAIRRIEVEYGLIYGGSRDLPAPEITSGAYQAGPAQRPAAPGRPRPRPGRRRFRRRHRLGRPRSAPRRSRIPSRTRGQEVRAARDRRLALRLPLARGPLALRSEACPALRRDLRRTPARRIRSRPPSWRLEMLSIGRPAAASSTAPRIC